MFRIVRSELLKMRHTFSLKLVILAPLVTLLLGYLLSGSYVQLSAYNWWYSMILPLVVSLCSASMIVREKKTGMQNIVVCLYGLIKSGLERRWHSLSCSLQQTFCYGF